METSGFNLFILCIKHIYPTFSTCLGEIITHEKSGESLCMVSSSCLSGGRFLGVPRHIPRCRGMKGSSAEKMQSEFPDRKDSAGGGNALCSQPSVMVWPLHSWACVLVLPCPAPVLHMAWLSCLSVHGHVRKDHGTSLGRCLFTAFTVNLLPAGLSVPFQCTSGHLEDNEVHRLLLVD